MTSFIAPVFRSIVACRSTSFRMCSTSSPANHTPKANREVVAHTARLAHLQLSDDEIERIVPDFDNILRFVDSMNEIDDVDTDVSSAGEERRAVSGEQLRPDKPVSFPYVDDIMSQAPQLDEDRIVVPRIGTD